MNIASLDENVSTCGSNSNENNILESIGNEVALNGANAESNETRDFPSEGAVSNYENFIPNGRPKRGRKRKVPEQSRQDRKWLYNNNKPHVNTKGNTVTPKTFDEDFVCPCLKHCTNGVPLQQRKRIFSQFWSMGSLAGRCVLLVSCTSVTDSKRNYNIFGHNVCKNGLLMTLQINESRLTIAIKKQMKSDTYADGRGSTTGGQLALPASKLEEVRCHINSFPKYISHYTRSQTDSKFLNPYLNLAKMYKLYKSKYQFPVSESYYKKRFYGDFNLRFKTPQKDTCKRCDLFKAKIKNADEPTRKILEDCHNDHLDRALSLINQMKEDLKKAKTDPLLEVLTYDLQKVLVFPRIFTNIVYYKRQLNLYNFGIHVGSSGKGVFNVWQENEASRGTQEVGSCLKKYILENIEEPVKNLICWSDACGGQNRSIRLVLMLKHVLQSHPSLETISLRYRQPGHSYLPNDSEFGDFECALKNGGSEDGCDGGQIYTDVGYMKIMTECRDKNKFIVNRMSPNDFFSIKEMEDVITNRKVDILKHKINWMETHEIQFDKPQPNIIKMRKKIDDDFQLVNIEKAGCENIDFKEITLGKLWQGRSLSKKKVADLKELLELVPDEYKYFYAFLEQPTTSDFVDDIDGFGEFIDFQLEEEE